MALAAPRALPRVSTANDSRHWGIALGLVLLMAGAGAPQARAQHGAAFGDSGWVAPLPEGALDGDSSVAGPRVAGPQHEPTGERILRAPFRAVFFPARCLARGLEALAGTDLGALNTLGRARPGFSVGPSVSYSGGAGVGFGLRTVSVLNERHAARWAADGTWSVHDERKARASFNWGAVGDPLGFDVLARYDLMPNRWFYGVGNTSSKADRGIYLSERSTVDIAVRFGPLVHQLRLVAGLENVGARRGYNGNPAVLDQPALAQTAGMLQHSELISLGAGGNFAALDNLRDPSRGVEGRIDVRQVHVLESGDFDFWRYHFEARAYVPVFSRRRVIAVRALQHSVAPLKDSATLPFYVLPESEGVTHFAAYSGHRFTDRHLMILHTEYRWLVWDRLWAFGLAEFGEVASRSDRLRLDAMHGSRGGGLRFAFTPTSVVRLQMAHGSEGFAAYAMLNEDF